MNLYEKLLARLHPGKRSTAPEIERVGRSFYLLFSAKGFDERKQRMSDALDKACSVLRLEGRTLLLRRMGDYLLFRDAANPALNEAFVLTEPLGPGIPSAESFVRLLAPEHSPQTVGRCLVYVDPRMKRGEHLYFCFQPGGTGFALHEQERVAFTWATHALGESVSFLTVETERLFPLCEEIFQEQVNPRLRNPYIGPEDIVNVPPTWLCGSEAELRRLTHAFCCTEPGLFDGQKTIQVVYRGSVPGRRGGLLRVRPVGGQNVISGRLTALGDLVLRCNNFTGIEWTLSDSACNRRNHVQRAVARIVVTVAPPSVQERAEAYLTLIEWLEDKLHDPKKRARYGLSAQPAARTETAAL